MVNYKKRQVRYNFLNSKDDGESNKWWFLIVNKSREISEIEREFLRQANTQLNRVTKELEEARYNLEKRYKALFNEIVFNQQPPIEGNVSGEDLKYKLICFDSRRFLPSRVLLEFYHREKEKGVFMDRDLYRREMSDGLANFLESKFR